MKRIDELVAKRMGSIVRTLADETRRMMTCLPSAVTLQIAETKACVEKLPEQEQRDLARVREICANGSVTTPYSFVGLQEKLRIAGMSESQEFQIYAFYWLQAHGIISELDLPTVVRWARSGNGGIDLRWLKR